VVGKRTSTRREVQLLREEVRVLQEYLKRISDAPRIERYIVAETYYEGDKVMGDKTTGPSYKMGDVGDNARVAQGENISWVEGVATLPDGEWLKAQFDSLLKRISEDSSLDDDTRELARAKTEAVAEGIVSAQKSSIRFVLPDSILQTNHN